MFECEKFPLSHELCVNDNTKLISSIKDYVLPPESNSTLSHNSFSKLKNGSSYALLRHRGLKDNPVSGMDWSALIFGHVAQAVNYYADLYLENDRNGMAKQEKFVENFNLPIPEYFDFIIVGGGGAGCLAANRLARANFSVLLLESGGDPPPPLSVPGNAYMYPQFKNIIHDYKSIQQKFPYSANSRKINLPMGKVLGGTTALNYMLFNRGSPYDFDNWANITDDESWRYDNLLKYFKATETYLGNHGSDQHGSNGEMPVTTSSYAPGAELFLKAGAELGYRSDVDPNGPQIMSFTRVEVNQIHGRRMSSYDAFIKDQAQDLREYLDIRRYATAQKILIDNNTREAYGIQYLRHGFPQLAYAKKEIILCAGSFGSPLLLMRSGIGPEADLEALNISVAANLPVGKNYQDHPILPLVVELLDKSYMYVPHLNLTESSMSEFLEHGVGPLTTVKGLTAQAFLALSNTTTVGLSDWPDIQLTFFFNSEKMVSRPPKIYTWIQLGRPKNTGSVKLDPNDINGPPIIDWNMLSEEDDETILMTGIKKVLEVFENTTVFKTLGASYLDKPVYGCNEYKFRSGRYWRCYISNLVESGGNSIGTCRMGKRNDLNAVVDSKLKVIGIANLRVIDASVMPAIPNTNLQAAVIAISEKGIAGVLEDYLTI